MTSQDDEIAQIPVEERQILLDLGYIITNVESTRKARSDRYRNIYHINNTHIVSLRLEYCKLKEIPASIGNCLFLEHLNLSHNCISKLPESFCNLTKLVNLDLSWNQLTSLPEEFGKLSNLHELNLSINFLERLPDSFLNFSSLRVLNLHVNRIKSLPDMFGSLNELDHLDLSENRLKTLPDSFNQLQGLSFLDLSHNRFQYIPNSLPQIRFYEKFRIQYNPLKSLTHFPFDHIDRMPHFSGRYPFMIGDMPFQIESVHLTEKGKTLLLQQDYKGLEQYYKKSILEMIDDLIVEKKLTDDEKSRLIHEITPSERTLLEEKLRFDHPIIIELQKKHQLQLNSGYNILL